jgi:chemotaxis protein CheY-P-specific phosphatase CheC/CheY-like chemotaxis protein
MSVPLLICDDSSFARKQMAQNLPEDWDVDINFASNGIEGIEAIKEGKGDIVFLDLNMPVLDGYGVLKEIKQQDLNSMVIVVSGDIQPEARTKVKDLGAIEFISKPIDNENLVQILNHYGIETDGKKSKKSIDIKVDIYDCYQEVANVAMGQAANLLARLLNVFVMLPIPKVSMLAATELHMALQLTDKEDTVSAVCQGFIGSEISGEALLIFNDSSFTDIARLMNYKGNIDDAVEIELLMDISSILIGASLKGMAEQLNINFSQGHPVVLGQHRKIDDLINTSFRWKKTLAVEINYKIENHDINCELLLLFSEDSIEKLNNKVACLLN